MASERRKRTGRLAPPRPASGYSGTPLAKKATRRAVLAQTLRTVRERMRDDGAGARRARQRSPA